MEFYENRRINEIKKRKEESSVMRSEWKIEKKCGEGEAAEEKSHQIK